MPERKHAGAPDAVLARPISLASYPVATGRPLPGHQRLRARVRVRKENNAPSASCCDRVVAKLTPYLRASRPPPRTGNHCNEIGDGAAEAILPYFAAPDSSAPTRQGAPRDKENQPEMPERKHAGAPDAVLARP